jgi:hypothetical protein
VTGTSTSTIASKRSRWTKFKEFILPLIFAKRLCDVFDDEIDRIAKEVGSRTKAFKLVKHDKKLVRFYLPLQPSNPDESVWSVIRTLSDKIGEQLTTHLRAIRQDRSVPTRRAGTCVAAPCDPTGLQMA